MLLNSLLSASMPLSASSPRCVTATNCSAPAPAERPVEAVVGGVRHDQVLAVDGAAEPLHRVVAAHVRLDVIDLRAAADGLERDAVQLVVRAELDARELDAHVAEDAAVVVVVGAAVDASVALASGLAAAEVDRRTAVDDEAAPVAAAALADRLVAREDDRRRRGADGVEPAAALDDERADAAGLADDRACRPPMFSVLPCRTNTAPRRT